MYYETFGQFKKTLRQLETWLRAAEKFAASQSLDPKQLLESRLAPDQFPFTRQVQIACDTAKLAASRLTGKEAPAHSDTEQSFQELATRVQSVVSYLDSLSAKDFEGAQERVVTQPRWEGKVMTGADYFLEHALPNFFFHATHVYALLRHAGVPLGKRDFLGAISLRAPT